MKFSILIPVYNTGYDLLRGALNSIVMNNFEDSEVIIYDDGSDEIRYNKLIDEFKDKLNIKYIRSEENKGTLFARYELIRKATKDYIIFLDSDDELSSNARELIVDTIYSHPDYAIYSFITKIELDMQGDLDPKLLLSNVLMDEFIISPYLTNKVFDCKFLKLATYKSDPLDIDRYGGSNLLRGITLGEDTVITLSYLVYLSNNCESIPNAIFHTNESWYIQKESHTFVKSHYKSDIDELKVEYNKLSNLRKFFKLIVDSPNCNKIYNWNRRNLNQISLRLSISKFTRCGNLYSLIDYLVKDFGWDLVIDYFKSREYLTMHLAQYFVKLDNSEYDYVELVHAYDDLEFDEPTYIHDSYGHYRPFVVKDGNDSDNYVEDLRLDLRTNELYEEPGGDYADYFYYGGEIPENNEYYN